MQHDIQQRTTESRLHEAVVRFNAGDPAAAEELLSHIRHRLMVITRGKLHGPAGFTQVARWNETDDVVQEVSIRLANTLFKEPINSGDHFLRLAAMHIRWALSNMHNQTKTRSHYSRTLETDPNHGSDAGPDGPLATAHAKTDSLFRWNKFLDRFKTLSKEQRQMLDDMFFNGCNLEEAADRLKIGITSFKKRWRALKLQLSDEGLTPFN